ncbi:hypothetical protein D3C87_244160 [compost metagenome]
MKNKKLIVGVAVGAAILAGAAVIVARRRAKNCHNLDLQAVKDNFRSKLHELQRKAEKEAKSLAAEAKDGIEAAKNKANQVIKS